MELSAESPRTKTLKINLDQTIFGTIAEIGAGQEVARRFFIAGGSSGTIAKTISAYSLALSDKIYGTTDDKRYVSKERLRKMLKVEFDSLIEVLHDKKDENTRFFAFADTVTAINFRKDNEPMDLVKKTLFVLVTLFLLNPVGAPWYFCWVIPFLCFFPYRSLLLLSWLLIFSYLSFAHNFGIIKIGGLEIPILNAIEYMPFFLFFIWEFILRKRNTLTYVTQ